MITYKCKTVPNPLNISVNTIIIIWNNMIVPLDKPNFRIQISNTLLPKILEDFFIIDEDKHWTEITFLAMMKENMEAHLKARKQEIKNIENDLKNFYIIVEKKYFNFKYEEPPYKLLKA
jgi:CRISPR/Cas system CMR-associated protein Cmr1 (group 7 of RAMP superfamily)